MIIQVCVGSGCHLKGSSKIIALLKDAIAQYHLENEVTLTGSFCIGMCSRDGVAVQVDDVYADVTVEKFDEFFREKVLDMLGKE